MNIEMAHKSKLNMIDMYFSRFQFFNKRKIESFNLRVNHKVSRRVDEEKNTEITILTTIENDSKDVSLELVTVGVFNLVGEEDEALKEEILNKNTFAILFPFIRSQISLMTTQPGFTPIILPPINVNDYVDNEGVDVKE